jgi:hypothetical protein
MALGSAPEIGRTFVVGSNVNFYPWVRDDGTTEQLMFGDSELVFICGRPDNILPPPQHTWRCHKRCHP